MRGSLVIAILPTYATIGGAAPVLLLLARMVQGLSVGGEYGTSATYMSEVAIKGSRGFYASFQYVTLIGGQLLASLVILVLQPMLTDEELTALGLAYPVPDRRGRSRSSRCTCARRLHETAAEKAYTQGGRHVRRAAANTARAFLIVLGYTAGGSLDLLYLHHLHAEIPGQHGAA